MLELENVDGNMGQYSCHGTVASAQVLGGVFACKIHYTCTEAPPLHF